MTVELYLTTIIPGEPAPPFFTTPEPEPPPPPAAPYPPPLPPADVCAPPELSVPPPPPPPTTEITVAEPSALFTNQTAMTISFVSNYADATFQCSLDSAAFSDCASPVFYSGLANGAHSFFVQASRDGITDSTGASHTWTVDTVAPQLASSVTAVATNSTITVNWTTNEPTTTTLSWGLGTLTNNVVASDGIYSTSHTVTLSGLTPNTIYSYIVGGADQAGNLLLSGRRSLRTNP